MTTSTHTADSLDTLEAIVSRAMRTGQLLPSMRGWALHLGQLDRAALLSYLDSVAGDTVATPTTTPDSTTSTTHTTGPWRFDARYGFITHAAGEPVASVCFNAADSLEQETANGHLIAAAPELLRVARLALADLDGLRVVLASVIAAAVPVVTKAEGGAA